MQVTWQLNGGVWPANDNHATRVPKGGTLAEPTAPVKTENTFEGWHTDAALTAKVVFPYTISAAMGNFTLYAKWAKEDNGEVDQSGYRIFTSIVGLKSWMEKQPANTATAAYKVGLKNVNLNEGNNWNDLALVVKGQNYADLNLQGCTAVNIPDGNSSTGIFIGCNKLVNISLPQGLRTIGEYAFFECPIATVILPEGLKTISPYAFQGCKLSSVTFPAGLESIHDFAFSWCENLTAANLPQGLRLIGKDAFFTCSKLSSVMLPEGLQILGDFAFAYTALTTVSIPGSVTGDNWGIAVFSVCKSLVSVVVGEGTTIIGEGAFSDCPLTTSIVLPSTLTMIGGVAFYGRKYTTITIPQNVTSMGRKICGNNDKLTEIIMLPVTPQAITESLTTDRVSIKVPAASLNAYQTANYWKDYASWITAM